MEDWQEVRQAYRRCYWPQTSIIPQETNIVGEGNGNPLQYSCLENPIDRGAWQATVHRVTKSQTLLERHSTHTNYTVYILNTFWFCY